MKAFDGAVIGAALVFSLVSLTCLYGLYLNGRLEELSSLRAEADSMTRILGVKRKSAENLAENTAKLARLREETKKTGAWLTSAEDLTDAVLHINRLMSIYGIVENEFTISVPGGNDGVTVQSLTVSGTAHYHDVIGFIEALQNSGYYYGINGMSLSSERVIRKDDVFIKLELSIYTDNNIPANQNGGVGNEVKNRKEAGGHEVQGKNPFFYR